MYIFLGLTNNSKVQSDKSRQSCQLIIINRDHSLWTEINFQIPNAIVLVFSFLFFTLVFFLVYRLLSMPCWEPFLPSSMCCLCVSYFGSSSASWASTYLRENTAIVSIAPQVNATLRQRWKTRLCVWAKTTLAGGVSKSTLTMWGLVMSHFYKW